MAHALRRRHRRTHPDVVGLLTGRWTIADREVDGATVHVGDPSFDTHVVAEYSDIVAFLDSLGVKVMLFNLPLLRPRPRRRRTAPCSRRTSPPG